MFIFRYLATGYSYKELQYNYRVVVSTISNIIKEMCPIIWNALKEKWEDIAKSFEIKADFPHCLGAVDGNT